MKKLSKIKLLDAVVLENREMKMIYGGSGIPLTGGCFSCSCNGQTNPPYNPSWTKFYAKTESMNSDISTKCVSGGGCTQVSMSNC